MKKLALFVACMALVVGCQTSGTRPDEPSYDSQSTSLDGSTVREEIKELGFIDSFGFDVDMSTAMRQGYRKIFVAPSTPFTTNAIPERLDKWLFKIKESGNTVVAQAVPPENMVADRSIIGAVIDVVVAMFSAVKEKALYDPAEHYSATLMFYSDSGKVKTVVFTHK